MGYTKLSESILTSSIWFEDHDVLRVWVYLLARAGPDGVIHDTVPAIAHACFLVVPRLMEILALLEAPDQHSRTPGSNGRRIVIHREPEWAIELVNYGKYRDMRTDKERRIQWREAAKRYRDRHQNDDARHQNDDANDDDDDYHAASSQAVSSKQEANKQEAVKTTTSRARFVQPTPDEVQTYLDQINERRFTGVEFCDYYTARGWKVKGGGRLEDWHGAVGTWRANRNRDGQQRKSTFGGKPGEDWRNNPLCRCGLPKPLTTVSCRACAERGGWLEDYEKQSAVSKQQEKGE